MSQGIFVTNGYPMLFALGDCSKYTEIREIVEAGGGELISMWTEGAIHLACVEPEAPLPFPKPLDHRVYTYYFVIDSHNLEELQDLNRYELGKKETVETDSPGKTVRNRVKFTAKEEQAMREYMVKYPGSYTSVSYWKKACRYGLSAQRSADTLRDHCKRMIKGKFIREQRTEQPTKKQKTDEFQHSIDVIRPIPISPKPCLHRISPSIIPFQTTSISESDSAHSDLICTPLSLSSRFKNSPSLLVTVSKQGREVQDIDGLKRKCLEECIPDRFKWLVQRCQQRSKDPVEEAEVLQVLTEMEGSVERTEAYFAQG